MLEASPWGTPSNREGQQNLRERSRVFAHTEALRGKAKAEWAVLRKGVHAAAVLNMPLRTDTKTLRMQRSCTRCMLGSSMWVRRNRLEKPLAVLAIIVGFLMLFAAAADLLLCGSDYSSNQQQQQQQQQQPPTAGAVTPAAAPATSPTSLEAAGAELASQVRRRWGYLDIDGDPLLYRGLRPDGPFSGMSTDELAALTAHADAYNARWGRLGDFLEAIWVVWTWVADAGAHTTIAAPEVRFVGVIMTFVGLLGSAALIAGVVDLLAARVQALKAGRSRVYAQDHFLILGYTPKTVPIIDQLVLAHEAGAGCAIVVLCDANDDGSMMGSASPHESVEDEIRGKLRKPPDRKCLLYVRRGDPMNERDLEMVSLHTAKAVIILSEVGSSEQHQQHHQLGSTSSGDRESALYMADASSLNRVLAVQSYEKTLGGGGLLFCACCGCCGCCRSFSGCCCRPRHAHRRHQRFTGHIVTELLNFRNANRVRNAGGQRVATIIPGSIVPRLMIKSSRQQFLSQLYQRLLGFEGSEFYLTLIPELVGCTVLEAMDLVSKGIVVGIKPRNGRVLLNPRRDLILTKRMELVVIAEDVTQIAIDHERLAVVNPEGLRASGRSASRASIWGGGGGGGGRSGGSSGRAKGGAAAAEWDASLRRQKELMEMHPETHHYHQWTDANSSKYKIMGGHNTDADTDADVDGAGGKNNNGGHEDVVDVESKGGVLAAAHARPQPSQQVTGVDLDSGAPAAAAPGVGRGPAGGGAGDKARGGRAALTPLERLHSTESWRSFFRGGNAPERVLMLGWREEVLDMLKVLDRRVTTGSDVYIVCSLAADEQLRRLEALGFIHGGNIDTVGAAAMAMGAGSSGFRGAEQVQPARRSSSTRRRSATAGGAGGAGEGGPATRRTLKHCRLHLYKADPTSENELKALSELHRMRPPHSVLDDDDDDYVEGDNEEFGPNKQGGGGDAVAAAAAAAAVVDSSANGQPHHRQQLGSGDGGGAGLLAAHLRAEARERARCRRAKRARAWRRTLEMHPDGGLSDAVLAQLEQEQQEQEEDRQQQQQQQQQGVCSGGGGGATVPSAALAEAEVLQTRASLRRWDSTSSSKKRSSLTVAASHPFPKWSQFDSTLILANELAGGLSLADSQTMMSMLLCRELQDLDFFHRVRREHAVSTVAEVFASTLITSATPKASASLDSRNANWKKAGKRRSSLGVGSGFLFDRARVYRGAQDTSGTGRAAEPKLRHSESAPPQQGETAAAAGDISSNGSVIKRGTSTDGEDAHTARKSLPHASASFDEQKLGGRAKKDDLGASSSDRSDTIIIEGGGEDVRPHAPAAVPADGDDPPGVPPGAAEAQPQQEEQEQQEEDYSSQQEGDEAQCRLDEELAARGQGTPTGGGVNNSRGSTVERSDVFEECMVMCEFLSPRTSAIMARHPKIGSGAYCAFFQSIEIVSQIMAMVSIRLESYLVLEQLLSERGCDICLVAATQFCREHAELSFRQLSERVRATGCILIAWKPSHYQPFIVNPPDVNRQRSWTGHNLLAVIGPPGVTTVGQSAVPLAPPSLS